jgi:hypothetical protein
MSIPPIGFSLGEAYLHNDFDIQGDIFSIFPQDDPISTRKLSPSEMTSLARDIYLCLGRV